MSDTALGREAPSGPPVAAPDVSTPELVEQHLVTAAQRLIGEAQSEQFRAEGMFHGMGYGSNSDASDEIEKRWQLRRRALRMKVDLLDAAMRHLRFLREIQGKGPVSVPDGPIDPATAALLEKERRRREMEEQVRSAKDATVVEIRTEPAPLS